MYVSGVWAIERVVLTFFFFSSRRRHTRFDCDWSSDVCSSDLYDAEVWAAMVKERDAGRTRVLGVSNVSLRHLQQLVASGAEAPAYVQNRCFARQGWDRAVRAFCAERRIVYQGFSLLTGNPEALRHPVVLAAASRNQATPPQVS